MSIFSLKPSDLQTLSAPTSESLVARIRRQFRFLPDPIMVTVDGDEVVVGFPEETPGSRPEAARLAEKARKRASEGNHPNPKDRK